nr:hypothetical protein [uncultured Sphingomonas sp.]
MAVLPPMSSPRAALKDLKAFIGQRGREQIWGLVMAVLVTAIIIVIFTIDPKINTAPPPSLVYVENYGPDRTDAKIKADQQKDSAKRNAQKEEKKRQFKELQDKLGIE